MKSDNPPSQVPKPLDSDTAKASHQIPSSPDGLKPENAAPISKETLLRAATALQLKMDEGRNILKEHQPGIEITSPIQDDIDKDQIAHDEIKAYFLSPPPSPWIRTEKEDL